MPMQGGFARDGWRALGLGNKKLLRDGVTGDATVMHFYEMDEDSTVGNAQHDFKIAIRVPGRDPYELQGLFRIPVKLIGYVGPGTIVPVKVHPSDPERAAFDWEHFEPGAATDDEVAPSRAAIRKEVHNAMPDATRTMMLDGWVQATKAGGLSKAEFDQTLTDAIESGMITNEDAEAARAKLA